MAWHFDETNDYVTLGDSAALTLGSAWSFGGWIKLDDNTGSNYQFVLSWGNWAANPSMHLFFTETSGPSFQDELRAFFRDAGGDQISFESTGSPGSSTSWQHVLYVKSGSTITQYIDGSSDGSGTNAALGDIDVAADLNLGRRPDAEADRWYGGDMASWAKWDRALSADEIGMLAAGVSPLKLPVSLAWHTPMESGRYHEVSGGITVTNQGTTEADSPRIFLPKHATVYLPAAAGPSSTPSNTPSPSSTPSNTPSPSVTPSDTPSPSSTPSNTPSPSVTPSDTPSQTPSSTPSSTPSASATPSSTAAPAYITPVLEQYVADQVATDFGAASLQTIPVDVITSSSKANLAGVNATIVREYLTEYELEDLTKARLTIVPGERKNMPYSRSQIREVFNVDIVIQKRIADRDEGDTMAALAQEVERYYEIPSRRQVLDDPQVWYIRAERPLLFDPDSMDERKVFLTVVRLHFMSMRDYTTQ